MLGWPGSDWVDAGLPHPDSTPPVAGDWTAAAGEVRHTFTHFHLILRIMIAEVPLDAAPTRGAFKLRDAFRPSDLPTVMRKAFDLMAQDATPHGTSGGSLI
jgi:A/G-specific adenine glycosylase